jgi:tetratricopeptide (TPR) repeat protein
MTLRFRAVSCLAAVAAMAVLALPVRAEPETPEAAPKAAPDQVAPDQKAAPSQPRNRTRNVEFLLGALKVAPDDTTAKAIEDRILALWAVSSSDTTNILMGRAKSAIEAKDFDLAVQLLDAVIAFKPDFAEGWNRRATVYFLKKDYASSMADIRHVLALEPRHFGAMAGMGMILNEVGNEKRALEVFRRVLEIHPHLKQIPDLVKTLKEKVEGRDI